MGSPQVPVARKVRIAAAAGVLLLAGTLSACSTSDASSVSDQQINYVASGGGVVTTYPVGHRKAVPHVSGTDLRGHPLSLSQFDGKVIVLNFWASWCPPCRAESSALEQAYRDTESLGVQFVGVDIRETGDSDGLNFVETHGVGYPSFADQSARIALQFRSTGIPPETPPSTLVIDRTGHIAARGLGPMRLDQLKSVVRQVASEAGS
jgi:peroxiredoxin